MIRSLLIKRENWDNIAVIGSKENTSYRKLACKAAAIQYHLLQKPEDNIIAIFLPNGSNYISALFAVIMSGMTAFPLDASMTRHEVIPLLKQAGVQTVITSNKYHALFNKIPKLTIIYTEEIEMGELTCSSEVATNTDQPMVLLGTSGTTGRSKLVQLSEKNVLTSVLGYIDRINFEKTNKRDTRFILATPFSSAYGLMILSACLMKSFPIVLLDDVFTLDMFYRKIETYQVTHYEGGVLPLQIMEHMAGRPYPYDISSLQCFSFGGSKVSERMIKNLKRAYVGIDFIQGYGMTEASPLVTKHEREESKKLDSVGKAIKGVQLAVEADGVITDAPFAKGEVLIKGANVMLGYYGNEEETKKVIKNGYLYTGDIGYLDEEGYLYICGRKKNIIIVRGFNVYPEEVEECILSSSLVKDCIVYGQIDISGNEIVCADVVPITPQINLEDIIQYCSLHLTGYKQPQKINVCDSIRKNTTGKIERIIKNSQEKEHNQ